LALKVSLQIFRKKRYPAVIILESHMENIVVKIVDLEREINEDIDKLVESKS
jgi:hypothetical protein